MAAAGDQLILERQRVAAGSALRNLMLKLQLNPRFMQGPGAENLTLGYFTKSPTTYQRW
jgi:hypothetical protein